MRTKQINLSIPLIDEALINAFTAKCKHDGVSRSEAIIRLIREHGHCGSTQRWQDAVAEAAKDEPLPEFLS